MAEIADREFVRALVQARRTRAHIPFVPGMGCQTTVEAYLIQAAVADDLGAAVAGWKVGVLPDGAALAAPIFNSDLVSSDATFNLSGDLASVIVEAELALRLGRDLPSRPGSPYSRAEILSATAEVFCGIELVATRFKGGDEIPFAARLADNFAHGAYAIGGGTDAFAELDLTQVQCTLWHDDAIVSDRPGGHPLGDPLIPVVAWASQQCDRLGGLRAGQFVTTGALNDPFPVSRGATIGAELKGIGSARMPIMVAQ